MNTTASVASGVELRGGLLRQPFGLAVLAGTEFWDRVSFHGLQSLLTLYMVEQLLLPGHVEVIAGFAGLRRIIESATGQLSTQALAAQIFSLYIGLVYFTPVIGGWIGDRVLGRRKTVALGAMLMTAGHFCMAFDAAFLLALLLLMTGAGCLRGNIASQVGGLYTPGDRRRADGFQIYYTGINLGAFVAPLVTGLLAKDWGWHYAFGFAGFGMLIGLIVYLAGQRSLPADPPRMATVASAPLTPQEHRAVAVLIALVPVAALFWVAQSQVWNVYNLWVRDNVDLSIFGWTMPVVWLQSLDGVAPIFFMPFLLLLWRWQAARGTEPQAFTKIGAGCLIFAAGVAWLAAAPLVLQANGKVPLLWAVGFHLISNFGWLFFVPPIISLYSRAAPAGLNGTMIGVYNLSVFVGSVVSGRLGGLYERWSPTWFWLLHAVLVAAAGVFFLAAGGGLRRLLNLEENSGGG